MTDLDLVTGGAGFIGSHICGALLKQGRAVRVIDNLSTGRLENLEALRSEAEGRLEFVQQDLESARLEELLDGVENVYHQAALVSVPLSIEQPELCNRLNLEATLRLFEAARCFGVRRVVYASSCAVYGNAPELPKREAHLPEPTSPYAVSKLGCELYGRVYAEVLGLETVGLRYFNVFGPRQDPGSEYAAVIPRFISWMLSGETPIVFGDGEQTRDFVFVDNVVEANLAAMRADVSGQVFNVASGRQYSINRVFEELSAILGHDGEPEHKPARAGEVRHSVADISVATSHLNIRSQVSFDAGLERTVEWFRRHHE